MTAFSTYPSRTAAAPRQLSPFIPAAGTPMPAPRPGLAPGMAGMASSAPPPAARPSSLTEPVIGPASGHEEDAWLDDIGQVFKRLDSSARQEILQSPMPGAQPAAGGFAPAPSPAKPATPEESAQAMLGKWPTGAKAMADPAGFVDETLGQPNAVDQVIEKLRAAKPDQVPDDLTRQEKGMLAMQLGLGIMSGGPTFSQALAQAGLMTLGSWQDMRAQRTAQRSDAAKAESEALGAELDVALEREKMGSREKIAGMKDTLKPLSSIGKIESDFKNGLISEKQRDVAIADLAKSAGGDTALIQNAKWLAGVKGIDMAQAADIMLASASDRGGVNEDELRAKIYVGMIKEVGAKRAPAATEKAMAYLTGKEEIPEEQPENVSDEEWSWTQKAGAVLADVVAAVSGAPEPAPTGGEPPVPPADTGRSLEDAKAYAQALKDSPELPPDPSKLEKGTIYRKDGVLYRYLGGEDFEVVK